MFTHYEELIETLQQAKLQGEDTLAREHGLYLEILLSLLSGEITETETKELASQISYCVLGYVVEDEDNGIYWPDDMDVLDD